MSDPVELTQIDACVERILEHAGSHVVLAAPLGLGKPNRLINALYQRVAADRQLRLTICTALSLARPKASNDLERRFLEPFLERQFGVDYPELDYVAAMRSDRLPVNVRVHEFYFQSGTMLGSTSAQCDYASLNYTHVARDLATVGINAIVHLVARRGARISLSSNPDVTLDLLDRMAAIGSARPLLVGVVHVQLPFLGGDADVAASMFDVLLDAPGVPQHLFGLPREDVDDAEHAIGLHASTLVRDGGTLQIGIGALSDALVHALLLRQGDNDAYRAVLAALAGEVPASAALIAEVGGLARFEQGLNGSSEMVMDGFMHLRRGGVLTRHVYADGDLQRALDAGLIRQVLQAGDARQLRTAGVLPARLDEHALQRCVAFGILPPDACIEGDSLHFANGVRIGIDLDDDRALGALEGVIAGRRLRGGSYLQGGFYLGSHALYDWLRTLEAEDYDGLAMGRISAINQLKRGDESLATLQRRDARFFNSCMMATALGAAVSDALEDGRVVSGVGGQYNFVALSHALEDARSILMLRSTRADNGQVTSNIRWNYGHATIPRHLRDVFVTEYGIADLRGKSDQECVIAMLAIADARFHEELIRAAKQARKLPRDFRAAEAWRANTPGALAARLSAARRGGVLPDYPFGSDFDATELHLLAALAWLKRNARSPRTWMKLAIAVWSSGSEQPAALARMGLAKPVSWRERLLARLLRAALDGRPG